MKTACLPKKIAITWRRVPAGWEGSAAALLVFSEKKRARCTALREAGGGGVWDLQHRPWHGRRVCFSPCRGAEGDSLWCWAGRLPSQGVQAVAPTFFWNLAAGTDPECVRTPLTRCLPARTPFQNSWRFSGNLQVKCFQEKQKKYSNAKHIDLF